MFGSVVTDRRGGVEEGEEDEKLEVKEESRAAVRLLVLRVLGA